MIEDERSDDFAAVGALAEAFTELVKLIADDHTATVRTDRLLAMAARCMPAAQHTGLLVLEDGRVHSVTGGDPVVERMQELRADTGEGPSLDALEVNDLVCSDNLATDPRWPAFGPRVVDELKIRSAVSYRLYLGPRHRAALTFVSDWPSAFDDLSLSIGAIFAAYASLALFSELVLQDELSPRRWAQVHQEIGVAVGILTVTGELSSASAYRRLHQAARALHQPAREVADYVIRHGELPPRATDR